MWRKPRPSSCSTTETNCVSPVAATTTSHILVRSDDITSATNTLYKTGICVFQLLSLKSGKQSEVWNVWKRKWHPCKSQMTFAKRHNKAIVPTFLSHWKQNVFLRSLQPPQPTFSFFLTTSHRSPKHYTISVAAYSICSSQAKWTHTDRIYWKWLPSLPHWNFFAAITENVCQLLTYQTNSWNMGNQHPETKRHTRTNAVFFFGHKTRVHSVQTIEHVYWSAKAIWKASSSKDSVLVVDNDVLGFLNVRQKQALPEACERGKQQQPQRGWNHQFGRFCKRHPGQKGGEQKLNQMAWENVK